MGIFKSIKKFFSSDINPDPSKLVGFVNPYPVKGGAIKMNSKGVVPQGYAFVLGNNGRALDAFREGEYFMSPAVLPECCKKLKIHKMDKKGNIKKKFKADLYFINLTCYEFEFKAAKTEMGNRAMGIFSAGSEGNICVSVKEPRDFIAALLCEFAYLRNGEAEKIVRNWVEESVTEVFRKNNFALSELVNNNPMIEEKSKSDVAMMLAKQGLVLEKFEFTYFSLPKKHQKDYLANKKKVLDEENAGQIATQDVEQQSEVEPAEQVQEVKNTKKDMKCDNSYMPFGNLTIFEQEEPAEMQQEEAISNDKDVVLVDEDDNVPLFAEEQQEKPNEQFVDLNIDNIIKQEENGKRCLKCGATNELDAKKCTVCGNKF